MKQSSFRQWLTEKWFEHRTEVDAWTGAQPQYGVQEYFQKYKWWLRKEYSQRKQK